jgi:uncharacterized membrane protein YfcA
MQNQQKNDDYKKLLGVPLVPREMISGFATGVVNGLFGAGGGIIAACALMRFCGFEPPRAHATTISVIFPLTLVGGIVYATTNMVAWDVLVYVAPASLAGSAVGAFLIGKIPSKWLTRIFSLLILAAGVWMLLS